MNRQIFVAVTLCFGVAVLVYFGPFEGSNTDPLANTPLYHRDSLVLAQTAENATRLGYRSGFGVPDSLAGRVKVQIDRIFYSPDTLKLFAFAIARIPEWRPRAPRGRSFYYDGLAMAGYRPDRGACWKLFYHNDFTPIGGHSYEDISDAMHRWFLKEANFASDKMYAHENGEAVLRSFNYTPADSLFWTGKGLMWRKGALAPGHFYFEVDRDPTIRNPARTRMKRPLPMSESTRQMFSRCRWY